MNIPTSRDIDETRAELRTIPFDDPKFKNIEKMHGDYVEGAIQVFFERGAYQAMLEHAHSNTKGEVGGVLLGRYCQSETAFVEILKTYPNNLGQIQTAHLQMSPEFWLEVDNLLETRYQALWRLGTYHTHPGFGVFLSGTDMNSVRRIFNHPRHVTIVIDPHKDDIGFFVWRGDSVVRGGCYLFSHVDLEMLLHQKPYTENQDNE